MNEGSFDALLPAAMAAKAEEVGVAKANLPLQRLVPLGILAGAFIALGANLATVVTAGGGSASGVTRLLGGVVFSLGLILVVVSGAELFTGNTLIVIAYAGRKIAARHLLRNWLVVYIANFAGAAATAALVVWSGQLKSGDGAIGARAQAIAQTKESLAFGEAVASGVLANCLVCLAVWMTLSARTLIDKIAVIVPPIAAFVAAGFEHSVANMYFFPVALLHDDWDSSAADAGASNVTMDGFLIDNLLPVTIGNVIGGALLVGLVYWFVYLRGRPAPNIESDQ